MSKEKSTMQRFGERVKGDISWLKKIQVTYRNWRDMKFGKTSSLETLKFKINMDIKPQIVIKNKKQEKKMWGV